MSNRIHNFRMTESRRGSVVAAPVNVEIKPAVVKKESKYSKATKAVEEVKEEVKSED